MVTAPLRGYATPVGADERVGWTGVIGTVAFGLVRPVTAVILAITDRLYRDALSVGADELRPDMAVVDRWNAHLAVVAELHTNWIAAGTLDFLVGVEETLVRTSAIVILTRIVTCRSK